MRKYGMDLGDIDNKANILPLRKDIHYCFDNRWFLIVPKIGKVETQPASSPQYVTHIISSSAAELWPIYHNTLVESLHPKSRDYLFARFAWAVLFRVKGFVVAGLPRYVIRLYRDENGKIEYKAERCTGRVLRIEYGGGGSQTATPLKRKCGLGSRVDEENLAESSEDSDISMEEPDILWDVADDWRGSRRRREQMSSDETAPNLEPDVEKDLRKVLRDGMLEQQTAEFDEDY
jgi:hypothetical protein